MIIIAGFITIDPAKTDEAVEAMRIVEELTQAEDGNIAYGFWPSHTEPGTYRIVEEWENEDAVNAHMATEHLADFLTKSGDFGVTNLTITRYDVSSTSKFM